MKSIAQWPYHDLSLFLNLAGHLSHCRFSDTVMGASVDHGQSGASVEQGQLNASVEQSQLGANVMWGQLGANVKRSQLGTSVQRGRLGAGVHCTVQSKVSRTQV